LSRNVPFSSCVDGEKQDATRLLDHFDLEPRFNCVLCFPKGSASVKVTSDGGDTGNFFEDLPDINAEHRDMADFPFDDVFLRAWVLDRPLLLPREVADVMVDVFERRPVVTADDFLKRCPRELPEAALPRGRRLSVSSVTSVSRDAAVVPLALTTKLHVLAPSYSSELDVQSISSRASAVDHCPS
jgi:hypothetical protein